MGILSRSFFSSVLLALNQHLKVPLIDEVELAVVHEGDVGDDARLPKQMCPLPCRCVRRSGVRPTRRRRCEQADRPYGSPPPPPRRSACAVCSCAASCAICRCRGGRRSWRRSIVFYAVNGTPPGSRARAFDRPRHHLSHVGRSDGVERRSLLPGGDVSPRRGRAGLVPPSTDAGVPVVPRSRRVPMHHVGAVGSVGRYDTHTRRCRRSLWHVASRLVP